MAGQPRACWCHFVMHVLASSQVSEQGKTSSGLSANTAQTVTQHWLWDRLCREYTCVPWLSWVIPFIRWWAFDAFAHRWLLVKLSELSSFYGLYNGTHGKYQDCYGVKFLGLNPWREVYPTKRQKILFVAPLGFYLFIYSKKKEKSYPFSRYHHSWAISRYHLSGTISHGIAGQLCKPTDSQMNSALSRCHDE